MVMVMVIDGDGDSERPSDAIMSAFFASDHEIDTRTRALPNICMSLFCIACFRLSEWRVSSSFFARGHQSALVQGSLSPGQGLRSRCVVVAQIHFWNVPSFLASPSSPQAAPMPCHAMSLPIRPPGFL